MNNLQRQTAIKIRERIKPTHDLFEIPLLVFISTFQVEKSKTQIFDDHELMQLYIVSDFRKLNK